MSFIVSTIDIPFQKNQMDVYGVQKYNTAHIHTHTHTQWTEYRKAIKKVFPFLMTALLFPMTMTIIINVDWLARFYEGMSEIKRKGKMKKNWSFYEGSRNRTIGIERWKWPLSRT